MWSEAEPQLPDQCFICTYRTTNIAKPVSKPQPKQKHRRAVPFTAFSPAELSHSQGKPTVIPRPFGPPLSLFNLNTVLYYYFGYKKALSRLGQAGLVKKKETLIDKRKRCAMNMEGNQTKNHKHYNSIILNTYLVPAYSSISTILIGINSVISPPSSSLISFNISSGLAST